MRVVKIGRGYGQTLEQAIGHILDVEHSDSPGLRDLTRLACSDTGRHAKNQSREAGDKSDRFDGTSSDCACQSSGVNLLQ